jgi:hypothetical protein
MCIMGWASFSALALTPSVLLNHAALRRPFLEQGQALPVQPALKVAKQLISLVHIRVRESAVPGIYPSDNRFAVSGQL